MGDLLNSKIWFVKPRLICGVMTGTSLDSIDIAFVKFENNNRGEHSFNLVAGREYKFPVKYRNHVLKLINKKNRIADYSLFQVAYSNLIAEAIKTLIKEFEIKDKIDAISVHGQTLWHEPKKENLFNFDLSHTYQSVSGTTLSSILEIPVVYDFRANDIALGGNGAPLIPIFDYHFLKDVSTDVIALNIGGISNLTYIPKQANDEKITGFDTGPGNMLIDLAVNQFFGKKYDKDGEIAKSGNVKIELFNYLLNDTFFKTPPPKSTGREKFNDEYFNKIIEYKEELKISNEDFVSTLCNFTAKTISDAINNFISTNAKIYISGGGRKNTELVRQLKKYLSNHEIQMIDTIGINGDLKEAIGFAYIAWRSIGGMYGNLPSATGARRKVRLGAISL